MQGVCEDVCLPSTGVCLRPSDLGTDDTYTDALENWESELDMIVHTWRLVYIARCLKKKKPSKQNPQTKHRTITQNTTNTINPYFFLTLLCKEGSTQPWSVTLYWYLLGQERWLSD